LLLFYTCTCVRFYCSVPFTGLDDAPFSVPGFVHGHGSRSYVRFWFVCSAFGWTFPELVSFLRSFVGGPWSLVDQSDSTTFRSFCVRSTFLFDPYVQRSFVVRSYVHHRSFETSVVHVGVGGRETGTARAAMSA
jgi:hypothetical protein